MEDMMPSQTKSMATTDDKKTGKEMENELGLKVWPENKDKEKGAGLVVGCNHTSIGDTNTTKEHVMGNSSIRRTKVSIADH